MGLKSYNYLRQGDYWYVSSSIGLFATLTCNSHCFFSLFLDFCQSFYLLFIWSIRVCEGELHRWCFYDDCGRWRLGSGCEYRAGDRYTCAVIVMFIHGVLSRSTYGKENIKYIGLLWKVWFTTVVFFFRYYIKYCEQNEEKYFGNLCTFPTGWELYHL